MRSTNLIATLTALTALGLAGSASAATYCVGSPTACPAGAPTHTELQPGLKAAQDHAGHDVVLIGAGTYETSTEFEYWSNTVGNTVEIVGEGDATVLKSATPNAANDLDVITVRADAPSKLAKVKVVVPDITPAGAMTQGIVLRGTTNVEDVTVTDSGVSPYGATSGIRIEGASVVRRAKVHMNAGASGISTASQSSIAIVEADIRASHGVLTSEPGLVTVRRSRIEAAQIGVSQCGEKLDIESSVIRLTAPGAIGLRAWSCGAAATLQASHVTIAGGSHANTVGALAKSTTATNAAVKIDNSIIQGVATGLKRSSTNLNGSAAIVANTINYNSAGDAWEGAGSITVTNGSNLPTGFMSVADGDYRLKPWSQLNDKARSESYVTLGGIDLAGKDRSVGVKRDLGAYEYQALAPVAKIAGAASVEPGQPLALSGAASHDDDAGDGIQKYEWSFGDGATATGATASHAWAQEGTYEVTLTVTDWTGKTDSETVSVVVAAKPVTQQDEPVVVAGGGGTGTGGSGTTGPTGTSETSGTSGTSGTTGTTSTAGGDALAPVLSELRLRRAKGLLRLRLSEAATLRLRVERRAGTRFRSASATKRVAGKAGANAIGIATKRLKPGRYRVVVTATDAAGNRSVMRLAFRVR